MTDPKFRGEEPLKSLVKIAGKRHLAELYYRKSVTQKGIAPRIVEPYGLTQGKQDPLVRCYQLDPQEGWRYFMIHKLDRVNDTGTPFKPRRRITLPQVKVDQRFEPDPHWTTPIRQYRNQVGDAMADGVLTREEFAQIEAFRQENDITMDEVRFVHASIFHRCLGAVLEDGIVDEDERKEIKFLHKVMSRLGWSVGD